MQGTAYRDFDHDANSQITGGYGKYNIPTSLLIPIHVYFHPFKEAFHALHRHAERRAIRRRQLVEFHQDRPELHTAVGATDCAGGPEYRFLLLLPRRLVLDGASAVQSGRRRVSLRRAPGREAPQADIYQKDVFTMAYVMTNTSSLANAGCYTLADGRRFL